MEERRADYPDICKKLNDLEHLINYIDKTQAVIQSNLQNSICSAKGWQERVGPQLDKMTEIIMSLPCEGRLAIIDTASKQIKFLWVVVSGMLLSLLIIVGTNIAVMNELRNEISFIKQHSYGVQEFIHGSNNPAQRQSLPKVQ